MFAKDDHKIGMTSIVQLDINTGTAPTIRQPPRRVPIALQSELDNHIQEMLSKGVIKQGQSLWASL